jgi:hypothetical protein
MKKLLFSLAFVATTIFTVNAQDKTTVVKDEKVTKKTSTVPQKVHNTFSKHKHYSGKKTKHVKVVEKTTTPAQ